MSVPSELQLLKAAAELVSTVTGKPCGVMRIPRVEDPDPHRPGNQDATVEPPYSVVYPVPGGVMKGAAYGSETSVRSVIVQISCVGKRGDQAVWLRDRARRAFLDLDDAGAAVHPLVVEGVKVMRVTFDGESAPIDDKGLVTAALRVALHVAAADTP